MREPRRPRPNGGVGTLETRNDVRFDGETCTIKGWVRLATLYDPDGNVLMLAQSLL